MEGVGFSHAVPFCRIKLKQWQLFHERTQGTLSRQKGGFCIESPGGRTDCVSRWDYSGTEGVGLLKTHWDCFPRFPERLGTAGYEHGFWTQTFREEASALPFADYKTLSEFPIMSVPDTCCVKRVIQGIG